MISRRVPSLTTTSHAGRIYSTVRNTRCQANGPALWLQIELCNAKRCHPIPMSLSNGSGNSTCYVRLYVQAVCWSCAVIHLRPAFGSEPDCQIAGRRGKSTSSPFMHVPDLQQADDFPPIQWMKSWACCIDLQGLGLPLVGGQRASDQICGSPIRHSNDRVFKPPPPS